MTTLLLSHLLIEKHGGRDSGVESSASQCQLPWGVPSHGGWSSHPPSGGRDQEGVSPALEDSPSEKRKKSEGLYKDSRIFVLLLLLPVVLKIRYQTPLTSMGRNVTSAASEQACGQAASSGLWRR